MRNHLLRVTSVVVLGIAVLISGRVLFVGDAQRPAITAVSPSGFQRLSGSAQLISVEPLPMMDGEMCQWTPASAAGNLSAALQQESLAARGQGAEKPDAAKRDEVWKRKPVRLIRDPYATYSSVLVDPIRNEVVMTDENLFNIMIYDRMTNTPPAAKLSEPKRMIGGVNTKIEFQCGVYIDPQSGDIYAVNNDSVNTLVIFSRQAKGNVPPDRELATPHGTFGIAVDEETQQMYLTVEHDDAVVVWPKTAKGDDPPIRLLQGDHTQMADPHGLALDTKNKRMFVSNFGNTHQKRFPAAGIPNKRGEKPNWPEQERVPGSGKFLPPSITVYPMNASGDTPPLRVIQGPKTQMDWPAHISLDAEHGELYVANDMGNAILVFDASANGDVAPLRVLKGPKTLIRNPTGVHVDVKNDELWVASYGNHAATVFKRTASGDTPPLRVIRRGPLDAPALGIGNPHPVAYDSKRDQILVPN